MLVGCIASQARRTRRVAVSGVVAFVVVGGCDDVGGVSIPARLEPVSPQQFTVVAGSGDDPQLAVRVRDANGRTVPNVTVTWEGGVTPEVSSTDGRGEARTRWRVDPQATSGPQIARATIVTPDGPQVVGFEARIRTGTLVSATVTRADTLPRNTGWVAEVGQTVAFTATGQDAFENTAPNVAAAWTVSDPTVARVDGTGRVTGLRQGVVRVIATIANAPASTSRPVLIVEPLRAREVAVGDGWSCALDATGAVYCWGGREDRSVLPPDTVIAPRQIAPELRFTALRSSASFACALTADSVAYCWSGTRGAGGSVAPVRPSRVLATAGPLVAVASLDRRVCGLDAAGVVRCAALNFGPGGVDDLAVGNAVRVDVPSPLRGLSAAGSRACGAADDAVYCWRTDPLGTTVYRDVTRVSNSAPAAAVEVGPHTVCVASPAGNLRCGGPDRGAETLEAVLSSPVRQFSAGGYATCGVTRDGGLECFGFNVTGVLFTPDRSNPPPLVQATSPDGTGWNAVAVSDWYDEFGVVQALTAHACAITGAGRTYCWGANWGGRLGVPSDELCVPRSSVRIPCSPTPLPVPSPQAPGAASVSGMQSATLGTRSRQAAHRRSPRA